MSVLNALRNTAGVPEMLIVSGEICRMVSPASCRRATAPCTTSPSDMKFITVDEVIRSCPSNIDTPEMDRGEACA